MRREAGRSSVPHSRVVESLLALAPTAVAARASSPCLGRRWRAAGGADIPINIPAGTSRVTFVWDQVSHIVTHKLNN